MLPLISEKLQYSFVLKEKTYKSKETGGYGYTWVVQTRNQEDAEGIGQVSLQKGLAFLLFFS